ncbi:MAG: N-acetylneuraminate synthase family protein [Alphaproteobacteria bacterium]|jgi:N-acetylneuraminate synthase/N,N'-diacetyllegionaminate synthase|nr:N-acetylneuraminate synthase family protein [Alphaproteobacteria bacterium]
MKLFGKNFDREVAIIAEVGVNHEGDVEAASELIRLAAEAGADAVKFQSYTSTRYASASDPARLERVGRFCLDEAAHRRLAAEAKALGIHMFSTPLSEDVLPLLTELFPAIKIASGDLTFEPLIRAAARSGKPAILSTGLGTVEEIDAAVAWFADELDGTDIAERLVVMHCVSAYPTPIEEANVLAVPFLAARYSVPVGYSNHVIGPDACLAAIALGADVIEVHFTDRKSGREFRDHELSFDPDDLSHFVAQAPRIRASLGRRDKMVTHSEAGNREAIRKGLIAAENLAVGTVLGPEHVMYARPATEFAALEINAVLGRRLKTTLSRGELIPRDGIEDA